MPHWSVYDKDHMSELRIKNRSDNKKKKNRSVNRRMEYTLSLLSVFVAAQVTSQLWRSLSLLMHHWHTLMLTYVKFSYSVEIYTNDIGHGFALR